MWVAMRVLFGIALALLVFAALPGLITLPRPKWPEEYGSHPSSWTNGTRYDLERFQNDLVCAVADPASKICQLGASFATFTLVARWRRGSHPQGETLCRKCGYILRGLSAPRCPECGERI